MGLPLIELSPLQHARTLWKAPLPPALQEAHVELVRGDSTVAADPSDAHAISRAFPLTYGQSIIHLKALSATQNGISNGVSNGAALRLGVVFCGRQAPGGHNIVTGLYDALKAHNTSNVLLGFVGGTEGLFAQKTLEVTEDLVRTYRNQGGFDMLGRTKDQLRSLQQVNDARSACESLKLDALVLIGGCGTNTDAAQLAETFAAQGCHTKIIGVPVTIDGDLKNQFVETDVGFDTTCKVYSQLISNICIDALSAEKYYYFIRLMGRRTSHITMECTLQSHPNMVILAEEVSTQKLTLFEITKQICDVIQTRSENEKYHGVILLPEGLIENIPEMHALIQELDHILKHDEDVDILNISSKLSPWASALFEFLPLFIKKQLLLDRESDGSVQLSQIEMEKLLAQLVDTEISRRTKTGTYKGKKFNAICHFFGYQARGSLPSNFDCTYANALGHVAFHLAAAGLNGYLATVTNLKDDVSNWRCGGAPLTAMMSVKRWLRGPGVSHIGKPALHPAKVDLKGKPYELLAQNAAVWQIEDLYCSPGPIQFEGPGADVKAVTLSAEDQDYVGRIQEVQKYLEQVKQMVKPGCPPEVLRAALSSMASVTEVLSVISAPSYQGLRPF